MKLLFSEADPDYSRYLYPYVVWAIPEPGECAADFFAAGFLPASPQMDRFYLCRQVRVPGLGFVPSSENRRILRKGAGIDFELVPRADFDYSQERRRKWLCYAQERFGEGIMHPQRLDTLMSSPVISHLLQFKDQSKDREVGTALLHLVPHRVAFYYYAFYDLEYCDRNLGMYMMTSAVQWFAGEGFHHIHLGTCYSERALYKTQFAGVEFFNGVRWSASLKELKHLLRRDVSKGHLLQDADFLAWYGGLDALAMAGSFACRLPGRGEGPGRTGWSG